MQSGRILRYFVLLAAASLGGCAYVTAVPTAGNEKIAGIRVYAPKTLVVVNGTGVTSLLIPDCSKEYALKIGTVFAKQKVTIEMANGMVTKIDADQDTTAIPLKLLDLVGKAIPAKGLGTSSKADGGATDRFGIFEASCQNKTLTLTSLSGLDAALLRTPTTPGVTIVKTVPQSDGNGDPATRDGEKIGQ